MAKEPLYAYVNSSAAWLDDHIESFVRALVPDAVGVREFDKLPLEAKAVFQWCDGWALTRNFAVLNRAETALLNAYPNSDALARKDHLAKIVEFWSSKRPGTALKRHSPVTVRLSLDYAEYVEESLMEADNLELLYSLEQNAELPAHERDWWILKPALVDCGAGIRLFSTIDELASNLELIEYEYTDDEEESESDRSEGAVGLNGEKDDQVNGPYMSSVEAASVNLDVLVNATGTMSLKDKASVPKKEARPQYVFKENGRIPSAQMRSFVAQQYIASVSTVEGRKWHVRAYVLCVGRLKVYVFREMLALLAGELYQPPWENPSLKSSLTNTALQDPEDFVRKESMRDFWAIPEDLLPGEWKERLFEQICEISGEVVAAATHTMADKFTPINTCFELFAVDFLIDAKGDAWLLEVNESPAFYEVGFARDLSLRLMESVIGITMEHMGQCEEKEEVKGRMVKVLDETDTLAKSNITEITSEQDVGIRIPIASVA